MPRTPLPELEAPRQALLDWCQQHNVGPQELATGLHCNYQHAWTVLRSRYRISPSLIGRLLIHYGVTGPAPAIAAAFKQQLDRQYEAEREAGEL